MLNPFPDLLTYSFFAPTLLRVAVALALFFVAYVQFKRLHELSQIRFPVVGGGAWIIWLSIIAHTVIGLMLFFGAYTQIAAILGVLGGIKGLVWGKRYPRVFVLCRVDYLFILVMCLSLLLSGAGALARDLPL